MTTTDLLRSNSELRKDRVWNWSIPAWYVVLEDGSRIKTCPNAGACAKVCYARHGAYRFRNVLEAHTRNLTRYLDNPEQWAADMIEELGRKRFRPTGVPRDLPATGDIWLDRWAFDGGAAVRIHDSGDFFSVEYLRHWLDVARAVPDVLFYAYTKEVSMLKGTPEARQVSNFRYLFSTGGLEDHLIDQEIDRHADVFPTLDAIADAGYMSQDESDLLAVMLPGTRVGIPANNIRAANRKIAGRRFSEMQPQRARTVDGVAGGSVGGSNA